MTKENYLLYLGGTIKTYATKVKKHIESLYIKEGIAKNDYGQTRLFDDEIVDIANMELDEKIISCIQKNDEALAIFEKWEFIKDYKYSVFFETNNLSDLMKNMEKVSEISDQDERNYLFDKFESPIKYSDEERIF